MTAATLIGIFIVPVFYVVLQSLVDRFSGPQPHPQPQPQPPAAPAAHAGPGP
jgi:hypothetical protein